MGEIGKMGRWAVLWGILLLAAALRLYQLGGQSLWLDEVYQVLDASQPLADFLAGYVELDPGRTHKSPLSLLLHRLVLHAGDGEFLLRLSSVLFSVAEVAVVFFLVRALLGYSTAALAALLLALSPLHVWYAQEVRYYSLWTLTVTCSFLFLAVAWRRGLLETARDRLGSWAGYVTSMAVAAGAFVLTALVLPLQWLSGALLWRNRQTPRSFRREFAWVHAAFLVVAIPVLLRVVTQAGSTVGTPRDTQLAALPYTFFTFVAGFSVGPTVGELHFFPGLGEILTGHPEVLLFLAVFAPLAILGAWALRRRTPARELLLPWAFGLPVLVWGASVVLSNTYNVRYALPALTAFTVVLAAGIVQVSSPRLRRGLAAAAVLCMGFALANYHLDSRYDRENVRDAVAEIRAGDSSATPVAITGQIHPVVAYYGEGALDLLWLEDCRPEAPGAVAVGRHVPGKRKFARDTLPKRAVEETPAFWLMTGRDWQRRGAECLEWLAPTHRVTERRQYTGVDLVRLVRRDLDPETGDELRAGPAAWLEPED